MTDSKIFFNILMQTLKKHFWPKRQAQFINFSSKNLKKNICENLSKDFDQKE